MKLYTKTGDSGTTALVSGQRVSKASLRIEAYGTIDELTAHLGYLHDILPNEFGAQKSQLLEILSRTMDCAALMASTDLTIVKLPRIEASHIETLEKWSDELMEGLPVLKKFTLPAGAPSVSYAHICRTVARRAERACIRLNEAEKTADQNALIYLNRLSDYLYAVTRKLSVVILGHEIVWR